MVHVENSEQEKLKRQDILSGMQQILEEENKRIENYLENRNLIVQTILSDELEKDAQLDQIVKSQERNQQELAQELQNNQNLQMAAVGALMERSDSRTWSLIQQVQFISSQLAKLTNIELDKRKLKMDSQLNDLSEKRIELTEVLLELLHQQSERRNDLVANLRKMKEIEGNRDDFWMVQYQRLFDRMPESLDKLHRDMDPELLYRMLMAGMLHFLPFLSSWAYSIKALAHVNDDDLTQVGVRKSADRQALLNLITGYINDKSTQEVVSKAKLTEVEASAPILDEVLLDEASAPPLDSPIGATILTSECVICMDQNVSIIFGFIGSASSYAGA